MSSLFRFSALLEASQPATSVDTSIAITPAATTFTGAGANPTAVLESIQVLAAADSFTGSGIDPTSRLESLAISPSADNFTSSGVNPQAQLESLKLTPAERTYNGSGVDPTAKLESLSLAPGTDSFTGAGVNPATNLESLAVTPAVDSFTGAGIDPSANLESINIAPSADSFNGTGIDPSIVLSGGQGSILIAPNPVSYEGSGVDPSISIVDGVEQRRTGDVVDYRFKPGLTIVDLRKKKKKRKKNREKSAISVTFSASSQSQIVLQSRKTLEHIPYFLRTTSKITFVTAVAEEHGAFNFISRHNEILRREIQESAFIYISPYVVFSEKYSLWEISPLPSYYECSHFSLSHTANKSHVRTPYCMSQFQGFSTEERSKIEIGIGSYLREGEDFIINPEFLTAIAVSIGLEI